MFDMTDYVIGGDNRQASFSDTPLGRMILEQSSITEEQLTRLKSNPIVYVFDILPDMAKRYFVYNPAFFFINAYHEVFVFGRMPNFYYLVAITIIAHALLSTAYICYKKLEKEIRDFL